MLISFYLNFLLLNYFLKKCRKLRCYRCNLISYWNWK